jgi:hypothetical protein
MPTVAGTVILAAAFRKAAVAPAVALLAMVSCLSTPLWAKGPTTRIVIEAPTLRTPVVITDSALWEQVAVWAGPGTDVDGAASSQGFIIDWPALVSTTRTAGLPRYRVSFYAKHANQPAASQPEHLAYVVWYEPGNVGHGLVYLPGGGEPWCALNASTILRGREGQWFNATQAWHDAAMRALGQRD